ncbi:MAG TPA: class I SAM-dependent methyltransferase, partial [Blastocatellia bacterium]|nr:class I SAM-dependent methyltransferase [Blastocatellia bacterium]
MDVNEIVEVYTYYAGHYENEFTNERRYTAYKRIPRLVIDELKREPARILDLGCGTGLSSRLFFEHGYEVTGIDITRAMIKKARRLPYKKLVRQNLEEPLAVGDDYFDAVVMIGVMEHIERPLSVFKEVHKKLRAGGLFAFTAPAKTAWFASSGLKCYYKKEI